ncbi:MAG: XTP/dITP diphosphatase [Lachnospiraceae bacterium]|nr:XTP/dITP diphosphatase [Lachnospiraceae bacterium]
MKIVFATGNEGKMKEVRMIMGELGMEILSMKEAGLQLAIEENGATFEENAMIKAQAIADVMDDVIVLADDSGLEIDYLNKEPGVHSSRYMGETTSYDIKNQHILDLLKGVEEQKRTARFVCTIAVIFPDGEKKVVRETIEGQIGYESKGSNGFGYDPIFYVPEFGCTTAELSLEQKNKISHRGKALERIKTIICNSLAGQK